MESFNETEIIDTTNQIDQNLVYKITDNLEKEETNSDKPRNVEYLGYKKVMIPYDYNNIHLNIYASIDKNWKLNFMIRKKKKTEVKFNFINITVPKIEKEINRIPKQDCKNFEDFKVKINSILDNSIKTNRLAISDEKLYNAYQALYFDQILLKMIADNTILQEQGPKFAKNNTLDNHTRIWPKNFKQNTNQNTNNASPNSSTNNTDAEPNQMTPNAQTLEDYKNKTPRYLRWVEAIQKIINEWHIQKITIDWKNFIKDTDNLFFYIVTEEDINNAKKENTALREYIRFKVAECDQFSYLNDNNIYSKSTKWVNTPSRFIKAGFFIPIPMEKEKRIINQEQFKKDCNEALTKILTNEKYWPMMQEYATNRENFEKIVNSMMVYARCESAGNDPQCDVWEYVLHRREKIYHCYSFSYYHILMIDWGLDARNWLWLTEWQCYDPVNAWMLFLAFVCEKFGHKPNQMKEILLLNEYTNWSFVAKYYNGTKKIDWEDVPREEYINALKINYNIVETKNKAIEKKNQK